jgi:hypothetical protein
MRRTSEERMVKAGFAGDSVMASGFFLFWATALGAAGKGLND